MSSQLALFFVLTSVGLAIYIEQKNSEIHSLVVWIIATWILYSGSKGLGSFLNIGTTIEAGSLPDRYFILFLGITSLLIIFKRQFPLFTAVSKNAPVVIIFVYSLVSVIWTKSPEISFRKWGREAVALILALLLCSDTYPIKTLASAFKKAIYAALPFSIFLIKYYPEYGRSYHRRTGEVFWNGIANQKNGLTIICAISILFLIWSFVRDLKNWKKLPIKPSLFIDILMILMALYLMMGPRRTLTYSATSFVILVLGLIFLLLLKAAAKYAINIKKGIMLLAIIIIATGIIMPFSGKIPIKSLPKLLGRTETLTDRTRIWNELNPYAQQHIFIGHGFGGFWTTSLRTQITSHAHNGYLDTILDLGLLGLFLYIIFILSLIKNSFKFIYSENQITFFFIPLILMFIIHNISEPSIGKFATYPTWLLIAWSFILADDKDTQQVTTTDTF